MGGAPVGFVPPTEGRIVIARARLEDRYRQWNDRWHAPYGSATAKKWIPSSLRKNRVLAPFVGPFAFQPNNTTRRFEYPWAYYATPLARSIKAVDLGGGLSGFPFVLSKEGLDVTIVDPFYQYGPTDDYAGAMPAGLVAEMNAAFRTNVQLRQATIEDAKLESSSVDRVYCISALEHFPEESRTSVARELQRVLKVGGMFVATIDLFLNTEPFTTRKQNEFGTNMSVRKFVEEAGLELVYGEPRELTGYSSFDPDAVQSRLEEFFLRSVYPVLTQTVGLQKLAVAP